MEKLFENLPVLLNLGEPEALVGRADAERDEDGETHIHIRLSKEASERLGDLTEVFDLKGIGFAGIPKPRTY